MSLRNFRIVSLLVLALLIGAVNFGPAGRAIASEAESPSSVEREVPSPVGRKGPQAKEWSRLDLAIPFKQEVIWVKIQPGTEIGDLMRKHGLRGPARALWQPVGDDSRDAIARQVGLDRWFEVGVTPGSEKAAVQRISPEHAPERVAEFVYAHISWQFPGAATLTPDDPQFSNQTLNLDGIRIRPAWDQQIADSSVKIAVIDSGLRGSHQDSGTWKQSTGWDYPNSQAIYPGSDSEWWNGQACLNGDGHGTQVATIAAGDTNNGLGIAGAGFNAGIIPIRLLVTTDGMNCVYPPFLGQEYRGWAVQYATNLGAKVINMSYTFGVGALPFEADSMKYAWDNGAIPVSTAGNSGVEQAWYPCAYDWVICVGGATWNGSAWVRWAGSPEPSNFGPWVDFSAPGRNVLGATANTTTTYKYGTGTSFAAPLVSGVLALLHADGKLTPTAKLNALAASADYDGWTTFGFLDAEGALNQP